MSLQHEPSGGGGIVHSRIERGARAEGHDGLLGIVQQIIVDRATGVLQAVVLHDTAYGSDVEVPAAYVVRSTGSHIYLDLDSTQLAGRPDIARPYDPDRYVPVTPGDQREVMGIEASQPVVTTIEENAAELRAPERLEVPDTAPDALGAPSTTTHAEGAMPPDEEVPPMEPSPTPSTTGELIHDRPTTSGMGIKSSVPTSPAPSRDAGHVASPVEERVREDDIATIKLPRLNDKHPEATDLQESGLPLTMVPPEAPPVEPVHPAEAVPPVPPIPPVSEQPADVDMLPPPAAFEETRAEPRPERPPLQDTVTNLWQSLEARLTLAAIIGLIIAGTVWRAISRARRTPGEPALTESAEGAEPAQREQREESNTDAARPARRVRWFGRGLALGVGVTALYAPMPGTQLRERIAEAIELWREKRL